MAHGMQQAYNLHHNMKHKAVTLNRQVRLYTYISTRSTLIPQTSVASSR